MTNKHIYVLRGDIQEIWEYGIYGVYTSKEEALKAAQHLINALSDSTRTLIPEYSYDQNKISSGLVISDLIINQTEEFGDPGMDVMIDKNYNIIKQIKYRKKKAK